ASLLPTAVPGTDRFLSPFFPTTPPTPLPAALSLPDALPSPAASTFAAIDVIKAGSGAANTLMGLASGTWNLGATQTYLSGTGTLTFSSSQIIPGRSAIATFNFLVSTTANLSGNNGNASFVFA